MLLPAVAGDGHFHDFRSAFVDRCNANIPLDLLHHVFARVAVTTVRLDGRLGGGISGMSAALSLGRQGFDVHLVEREKDLGGNLQYVRKSLQGYDWREHWEKVIADVDGIAALPQVDLELHYCQIKPSSRNLRSIIPASTFGPCRSVTKV